MTAWCVLAQVESIACGDYFTVFRDRRGNVFAAGLVCEGCDPMPAITNLNLPHWCIRALAGKECIVAVCEVPDGTGKAWGEPKTLFPTA